MHKFRLAAKKFFITISNVEDTEITKEFLQNQFQNYKHAKSLESLLISKELHKNNIPHYHIVACFNKKLQITNPEEFNFLCNKQTNIQTIKNLKQTVLYAIKHGDFLQQGKSITSTSQQTLRNLLVQRLKTNDLYPKLLFEPTNSHMDLLIYNDGQKPDLFHKKFKAYQHAKILLQKPIIDFFDLKPLQNPPAKFAPYSQACLPILEFINDNTHARHYKSPNALI